MLVYFFNNLKVEKANTFNSEKLNINVEDDSNFVLSVRKKFKIFVHLDFNNMQEKRDIRIFLKDSYLKVDLIKSTYEIFTKKNKKKKKFKIDKEYVYKKQFENFILNSRSKKKSLDSFKDSLKVVEIIDKIKKIS